MDTDVNVDSVNESVETPEGEVATPEAKPNPLEPGGVRFEQVYGKMKDYEAQIKSYKELGDAAELQRIRQEHAQWKKAIDDYKAQQSMTPDEKSEAQRAATIRKELLKVYPELEQVNTVKELMKQIDELRSGMFEQSARGNLERASASFAEVLKANKIDLKHQAKLEEYVAAQMSDEEKRAFIAGDFSIAEKIFNNELQDGLFASMRTKSSLPTPMTRNTPGGTPPGGKQKSPSTLKEAEDAAWSRLKS